MIRSSEYGVRCECGKLVEPGAAGIAACSCGKQTPYRVEMRTFYVTGEPGSNRCQCPVCTGADVQGELLPP